MKTGHPPTAGGCPPMAGGCPPMAGGSPPMAGGSPPMAGGSPPAMRCLTFEAEYAIGIVVQTDFAIQFTVQRMQKMLNK